MLDEDQPRHRRCEDALRALQRPLITVESVVAEAAYLLRDWRGGAAACVEFILNTEITVIPCTTELLGRAAQLLRKYNDVDMDLADAMLVALAENTGIHEAFTLDRHFHIYRIDGRKAFTVIPELSS